MKFDFSTARIHCSAIGYLMSGQSKSPLRLWEKAVAKKGEWQAKYDALDDRKRGMKTGLTMLEKMDVLDTEIAELEPLKDTVTLSRTAKSYLKRYYAFLKYGKWSASLEKGNKYTAKGKLAEADSIELLSKLDGVPLKKNDTRLQSQFLTGEIDVYVGEDILAADYIYDVKTSWDIETFVANLGKDLYSNYWWQMQGYFSLSAAPAGEVSYCLVDTPESILAEEKYKLFRRLNVTTEDDPVYKLAEAEMVNNMTFSDMPIEDRRLKFVVQRDDEAILKVYQKVIAAREYLAEIQDLHEIGVYDAKKPVEQKELEDSEEETIFESN